MSNVPWINVEDRLPAERDENELGEVYVAFRFDPHDPEVGLNDAYGPVETMHWAAVKEAANTTDPEIVNPVTHWARWELPPHPKNS